MLIWTIFTWSIDHVPLEIAELLFHDVNIGQAICWMTELVECHSGYTYAERPTALQWEGERLVIDEIEARWRIPGGRRFRVRVEDGRVFELFYGELYDEWRIAPV